jgi:protease-4
MKGLKVGGDYADSGNSGSAMTPTQRAAFGAWMDRIYNGFVARVAEGRKLPAARVAEIAKGRVWTGTQAKDLGLVDSLGGLPQAIDRAKALAGITGEARMKPFATETNPFGALARLFGGGDADQTRLMAAAEALAKDPEARAALEDLSDARLRAEGATVLAPRWVH